MENYIFSTAALAIVTDNFSIPQFIVIIGRWNVQKAEELQRYFENTFLKIRFLYHIDKNWDKEWKLLDLEGNLIYTSFGDGTKK